MKYLIQILIIIAYASCTTNLGNDSKQETYDGPMIELEEIVFFYSDSAIVKVKGISKHRMDYANGDKKFPKGLYLEFYDDDGNIESTIKANKAFFNKERQEWLGQEDVVVVNTESNQQLNTEELFWLPSEKRIYTDKFVTIKRDQEILHGRGLEAAQDMSSYSITKPEGEFLLKEEEL